MLAHAKGPAATVKAKLASADIPTLDFSGFLSGDVDQKKAFSAQLHDVLTGPGFFYLENHGIDESVMERAHASALEFFGQEQKEKEKFKKIVAEDPLYGWVSHGSETLHGKKPDEKEAFDFSTANYKRSRSDPFFATRGIPEWQEAFRGLALEVLKAYALSLNLEEDFFSSKHLFTEDDVPVGGFRFNYYPPLKEEAVGMKCAPHTDYVPLVVLWQDDVGGLDVWDRTKKEWRRVEPKKGTLILNTGNLMQRWTNNKYLSTLHRVTPNEDDTRARVTMLTYMGPNTKAIVDPRDLGVPDEEAKYDPVSTGAFFGALLEELYSGEKHSVDTYGDPDAFKGDD